MEPLIKVLKCGSKAELLVKHFEIINVLLPDKELRITDREGQLLAEFIQMPGEKFSTKNKRLVREAIQMNKTSLDNHIKRMKAKGLIYEKEDGLLDIVSWIVPDFDTHLKYEIYVQV